MFSRIPKSTRILLAFAAVYLIWGSTYVAIHVAGEKLPVLVVGGVRCLFSASLIGVVCLCLGKSLRAPKDEIWKLVLIGLLFMSGNNLLLIWGETMVPSGYAALIVCTLPIAIALLETMLPGGERMNKRGWAGTLLGTFGICAMAWPSLHSHAARSGYSRLLLGTVVLLAAVLCWAVGAVLARRFQFKTNTFVATGWEIGAAGIFNMTLAIVTGKIHYAVWTWHGVESIGYLSIFGSLCGLVSFNYLLQHVPVTKVSTYAFVNPIIAVLMGVALLGEHLASSEVLGMGVILCSVAMVVYSRVNLKKEIEIPALE